MKAADLANQLIQCGVANRHRNVIMLTGSPLWQQQKIAEIFAHKPATAISDQVWSAPSLQIEGVCPSRCDQLLGTEVDHLLFDAAGGYDATALGITSGCVRAGGLFVIVAPAADRRSTNSFDQYCHRILCNSEYVMRFDQDETPTACAEIRSDDKKLTHNMRDQQKAVEAICHVVNGQRKRPAVLVADRGRGKSAALGIAASKLFEQGVLRIIVTGRSRRSADKVFEHCDSEELTWLSAEKLIAEQPSCDLLLIDEAASLPVSALTRLLESYSRIAMATTVNGYEGSGQGFMLRFAPILNARTRGWKHITLNAPIRWNTGDPLESLTNRILVQDAELPALTHHGILSANSEFEELGQSDLGLNEPLLREVFSLLSLAHYQTRPSDLSQLLDNSALRIFRLAHEDTTIGVALVILEGDFSRQLSQQVFIGTRRPQGHVLPEILTSQLGQPDAATLKYARIMRIVIHPALQLQGLGSHLLKRIDHEFNTEVDILGSHFSATAGLLHFWRKQGYSPVRIGQSRSVKTAGHSAVVLKPQTDVGQTSSLQATADFAFNFPAQIANVLSDLEPACVIEIIEQNQAFKLSLHPDVIQQLIGFSQSQRNVETLPGALVQFAVYGLHLGILNYPILWTEKILMTKNWPDCRDCTGADGWKSGNQMLREDVQKTMQSHFNKTLSGYN